VLCANPAFSAIGQDLIEHRVCEIALRARADRPASSYERRSVAELMPAMMEVASIGPRRSRRKPGSAGDTLPATGHLLPRQALDVLAGPLGQSPALP
jgi:hypothetical protein